MSDLRKRVIGGAVPGRTAVSYFDNHAEYYEKNQYGTTRRTFVNGRHDQLVAMLPSLQISEAATVLDAGCGPGNLIAEFAQRCGRVVAMDASPRMLELARARAARFDNVEFQAGSIEALPFADGTFHVICSAGVIEYLPQCDGALREMYRVLKPGGMLILPTTNALAPGDWLGRLITPLARIPTVARCVGLEPASYRLRYHIIPKFRKQLRDAWFTLERERYFYLTLPKPLDRLFPGLTRDVEKYFDRYMHTALRHLAEGYIAVARKSTGISRSH